MNADLLKRLVRAIADGSQDDLHRLAHKVVDTERRSGHVRLADDLDTILKQPRKKPPNGQAPATDGTRSIRELPISRRHRELLVTILPRDSLEHHMVLPGDVEERFARIEREFAARERLAGYGLMAAQDDLALRTARLRQVVWAPNGSRGIPVYRLMKVRFDALLSSYFGESAANLRAVFHAARNALSPSAGRMRFHRPLTDNCRRTSARRHGS